MQLTTENVRKYIGGHLEMTHEAGPERKRGRIKKIWVDTGAALPGGKSADLLHVEFESLAVTDGTGTCRPCANRPLCVNVSILRPRKGDPGQFVLAAAYIGETWAFTPPMSIRRALRGWAVAEGEPA